MTTQRAPERPARVRISEESALLLLDLLDRELRRLATSRAEIKAADMSDEYRRVYNHRLRVASRVEEEIDATGIEMGWWPPETEEKPT